MVSLIIASFSTFHYMVSYQTVNLLNVNRFPPVVFVITPPKRHYPLHPITRKIKLQKQNQFLLDFSDCGVVGMRRNCWVGDGDDKSLELELVEFMNNSNKPNVFPSKRELIESGRIDLVEAIMKNGGWMLMGWDDNEVKNEHGFDLNLGFSFGFQSNNVENSLPIDVSSSNDQPIGVAKEDSGIEGILSRLERERNQSFGLNLRKNGSSNHVSEEEKKRAKASKDVDSCHPDRNRSSVLHKDGLVHCDNGTNKSYTNSSSNSRKGDAWRTWSLQRAGVSDTEFEAAEIEVPTTLVSIIGDASNAHKPLDKTADSNPLAQRFTQSDVKARLRLLKLELSSVIRSLGSNTVDLSEKVSGYISDDWRQLSDASEFQENELMHAQDKLRSMRANLTVLEGKMSLAVSDAQKILNEKQKKIDGAHRALQLLRTTCIVWPNSGLEVLIAGSFDGWSTQRKMVRSSNGVFSLSLKLYPGKYEIKFIVDGSWKIDPLRAIVNHSGYENNLLIVN